MPMETPVTAANQSTVSQENQPSASVAAQAPDLLPVEPLPFNPTRCRSCNNTSLRTDVRCSTCGFLTLCDRCCFCLWCQRHHVGEPLPQAMPGHYAPAPHVIEVAAPVEPPPRPVPQLAPLPHDNARPANTPGPPSNNDWRMGFMRWLFSIASTDPLGPPPMNLEWRLRFIEVLRRVLIDNPLRRRRDADRRR